MMKRMSMDADTAFLPQEIIANILKRLPVKSIIRSQCVCKRWKNLIKSPSFIAEHLHLSTHKNPSLLLQQLHRWEPFRLSFLGREMQFREVENSPLIDSLGGVVQIVGSSNGLLCLTDNHGHTLLWNPTIREVRQLPITIQDFPGECNLGFGYSPVINDYKIVRICVTHEICGVEVFSLSTGSWKDIEFENSEGRVGPLTDAITVNGFMFWYGFHQVAEETSIEGINVIISFDIALEAIKVTALPDVFSYSCKPTLYENKLAIIDHKWTINSRCSYIHLGVMEEEEQGVGSFGERWSLSKKYTCCSYPFRLKPNTIWNDQIVCTAYGLPGFSNQIEHETEDDPQKVGVYLFNVTTNERKKFTIPKHGDFGVDVVNYVESLVSVSNFPIIGEP